MNPALRYTALNQLVRLALGPIVLVALPLFLSAAELGFWYAMSGIAAIMAFADMGVSTAVMQFSAHEHARLEEFRAAETNMTAADISRQDALLLYAVRRIGRVCLAGVPLVFGVGFWLMNRDHGETTVSWQSPWICFCIVSALSLMLSVMLAYHEGQDAVAPIQRLRAGIAFITLTITVGGTASGLGLWTLPLATGVASLFGFVVLTRRHLPGLNRLCSASGGDVQFWSESIAPVLTRYSLSWVGGYLMFQLFAPITIYLRGPVLAGRVGLTASVFTSIFTLANVWSSFRLPLLSMAVARRNGQMLRRVFLQGTTASFATYVLLSAVFIVGYIMIKDVPVVAGKLLDLPSVILLAIGWAAQTLVHNAALFLRAFKEDPLVTVTWLAAIHTLVGTAILLSIGATSWMFLAFATSYAWLIPKTYSLSRTRLREVAKWPAAI